MRATANGVARAVVFSLYCCRCRWPLWPCAVSAPSLLCAGSFRRSSRRCSSGEPGDRRRRASWRYHQTRRSATPTDRLISAVTVTDPRHPLYGQRLAVLSLACARGPRFIAVALPDGRRRLIRRGATDLERPAGTNLAVPRVSARTLLPLARHVRGLVTASSTEIVHAVSPPRSCTPTSTISAPEAATAAMASAGAAAPAATGPAARPPAAARPRGGASC